MKPALFLPVSLLVLLAGCSGFRSREPAEMIYLLQRTPAVVAAQPPVAGTLAVMLPSVSVGLESDRIPLTIDGRMNYYSASRWSGELPAVLRTLLLDALRGSGHWRAVLADGAPFSSDQLLQIEIRHFEAEYSGAGPPVAHVLLEVTLGQRGNRAVLRSARVESRVAARADRMSEVVAAFNAALNDALNQLALVATPAAP